MSLRSFIEDWILSHGDIEAAVLFGSTARRAAFQSALRSDIDIHLVVSNAALIVETDWVKALPMQVFCCSVNRPATGGVTKTTVVFASGQVDLILVPKTSLTKVKDDFYRKRMNGVESPSLALNEMATCLHGGYSFIKGEPTWGAFYRDVSTLGGVRLSDAELDALSVGMIIDTLWVSQKARSGELIAAQYVLHCKLSDTCLRLYREAKLRRGEHLKSFGLGRNIEATEHPETVEGLTISARPNQRDIILACQKAVGCMLSLMGQMRPEWHPNKATLALLSQLGVEGPPTAH